MKKILLVFCLLLGLQLRADAVIVEPYIVPIPNYYAGSAVDFSINVGTPFYPYCDPYYPYYCRTPYYGSSIYVGPTYWNIGLGWGRPYYRHHHHHPGPIHRPHPVRHYHSAPPHHGGGHHAAVRPGHHPSGGHKAISSGPARSHGASHGISRGGSHGGGHGGGHGGHRK